MSEKKKTLLALDISTTNIGVAVFDYQTKELLDLTYCKLQLPKDFKGDELFAKLNLFKEFLKILEINLEYSNHTLTHVAVEEALKGSINPSTAQRLYAFNALVRYHMVHKYNIEPTTIDIHTIRKVMLPQYVTPKGTLSIPKNANVKKLVWMEVYLKHPQLMWEFKKNSNEPKDIMMDMSDAYAVGIAYFDTN